MVNLWRNYKKASKRQKQALHSLFVGLAFFGVLLFISSAFQITICPIQRFFNIPCFGCGLTRGMIAILHFDFIEAIRCHVLSIPIFIGGMIYAVLCITDILFNRNDILKISELGRRKFMFVIYLIILIVSVFINRTI